MSDATLTAQSRPGTGKGAARTLRREGFVPGVVYGGDKDTIAVAVKDRDLARVYDVAGTHGLVDLEVTGDAAGAHKVLIKDIQTHPVRGDYLHVDFHAVALDEEMQTEVALEVLGESRPDDGIVTVALREVLVSCLPADIPETIVADATELEIGDVLTVADLKAPKGVTILSEPDEAVLSITVAQVEEAADPAADEGADAAGEDAEEA